MGYHLIERILKYYPNVSIKIIDIRCPDETPKELLESDRVIIRTGRDICKASSIENDFANIDTVIHLAGKVSFALKEKDRLYEVNTNGTKNVAKIAKANNIDRFIHISSVAALGYGQTASEIVNEEFTFDWTEAVKFNKHYSLSKHYADLELGDILQGCNYVRVYPGLMLGPWDMINSPKLINALASGKIRHNMPGGTNIVDVRDVAEGICQILKKDLAKGDNILGGENLTFTQINSIISELLNVKAPSKMPKPSSAKMMYYLILALEKLSLSLPVTADNVHSSFKHRYFDNSKAKKELDWTPQYSFKKTISDTIEWMEEHGLLKG